MRLSLALLGALLISTAQTGRLLAASPPKATESTSKFRSLSELEIDRIDFRGVTLFTAENLEKILEIFVGERLERSKVLKTEENIQDLYRVHGYPEVKIQSRLVRNRASDQSLETALVFDVYEGLPIRVAKVKVVLDTALDSLTKKSWGNLEGKIRSKLGLDAGDILDQEHMNGASKVIQEYLASESYMGTKVTDVKQIEVRPSSLPKSLLDKKASHWIELEFHLELGDRVDFGFQGNTVFTYSFLDTLVDEQRMLGLGKDYVGAIRQRIEDEYKAVGYPLISIKPYVFEESATSSRKVTYFIDEGPKVTIESVDFDGDFLFSSTDLRKQFFSKASALVQNKIYIEKDIQKAADNLVNWMKEQGYLSARVVTINTTYLPKSIRMNHQRFVRLLIYLFEGDQTLVQSISIRGATILSEEKIKSILKINEGAPLNLFGLSDGLEELKKLYQNQGYLSFRILNEGTNQLVKYSQENRAADISLNLDEGFQYQVGKIEIEGLENTKPEVVTRELSVKLGDIISLSQLSLIELKLRRLGIFSKANVKVLDDLESPTQPNNKKIIKIILQEGDRGVISGGPGYRNDLGIRAFGQFSYANLWGEDHTVSMNVALNRRFSTYQFLEGQAQLAYSWPWFLRVPELSFKPFLSFSRTQYINFAATTLTAAANWQKPILRNPNLLAEFSYSFESIDQFQAQNISDNQRMTIGTISPKLSVDLRDNPLLPTSGFYALASLDYASTFLGSRSDIGFYRVQARTDYYLPFTRDIGLYLSFRTGYEETLEPLPSATSGADSIPLIKQFALGGIGSIRGYQLQELNFQGRFHGRSLSYVNYRGELDLPFAGALKLALFVDAGNLNVDHYAFGNLTFGTGFGFHYLTPVGPVSFDYGFKIAPAPKTDPSQIHFSVGII